MADLVARIAALWRYPVKSCAGEAVDALTLDTGGWPEGDRVWGVVDAAAEMTWMGAHPRLALVNARVTADGIKLQALGRRLTVATEGGKASDVRAWNGDRQAFDLLQTWDAGDDAADLLQAATGAPLRLVRLSADAQRRPGLNALHVVGDGSLRAWQQAWPGAAGLSLDSLARRARPNMLVQAEDGSELPPFIEDIFREARTSALTLRRTLPCVRCVVPTVDPTDGEPHPPALAALTQLSAERLPGAPVQFGVYARGDGAGQLRVGDRVELTLDFDKP